MVLNQKKNEEENKTDTIVPNVDQISYWVLNFS